jgi:hypothetical protein
MDPVSARTAELLNKVYSDDRVTPAEIMAIRDAARASKGQLIELDGADSPLVLALQQMDDLAESLQVNLLAIRGSDMGELGKMHMYAAVENYVALIKANADGFIKG